MASAEKYRTFPFPEKSLVKVRLYSIPAYAIESQDENYQQYHAQFKTSLWPLGKEVPDDDIILGTVTGLTDKIETHELEFVTDTGNGLWVLFTSEDKAIYQQFNELRIVDVILTVHRIDETKYSPGWVAVLSLSGNEENG